MHQVRDKRPRFRLRLVRKLVLRKILRHGNQFPSDVIPRLQHAFRLAGSRPRGFLRGFLRPQGSQGKTHSQPHQRKSGKTFHLFSPLSVEAKGFLSRSDVSPLRDVSLKWEKDRPTGPWPNAPSDQCLPVSILVQRNALVLPIQFHLPDKSLPEKWFWAHFDLSGFRVNQALAPLNVLPSSGLNYSIEMELGDR